VTSLFYVEQQLQGETMNVTDSIPSSESNRYPHNAAGKNIPSENTAIVDTSTSSDRYGYFVPLIMLIVLTVIVFATFFDKKTSEQIGGLALPEQDNESAAPAKVSAGTASTAAAGFAPNKSAASDLAALNADTANLEAAADKHHNEIAGNAVTTDKRKPRHDEPERHAYAYTPPSVLRNTVKRPGEYQRILQARREAYQTSTQMPGLHRQKMREYRTVVLKRIRQDRRDRHQRIKDIYRRGQYRHHNPSNRSEQMQKM
jgi:hypothetical protein